MQKMFMFIGNHYTMVTTTQSLCVYLPYKQAMLKPHCLSFRIVITAILGQLQQLIRVSTFLGLGAVARSDPRPPGMPMVAVSILMTSKFFR